jgi:molybdenum cofactor cytidylyltransferase
MTARPFVSGLLLAAGSSSRFGRVKQLEQLDGATLVERAVKTLCDSDVEEVVVVVGNAAAEVQRRVGERDVNFVLNPDFKTGLSSSLKVGIRSLDGKSEAVVVCLADQPFVTVELVDEVVARFRSSGADAVSAASGDLISPPMLISRKLYGQVAALKGDKGAKAIAMAQPSFVRVEVNKDILLDIDTEEEMSRAKELLARQVTKEKVRAEGAREQGRPSSK